MKDCTGLNSSCSNTVGPDQGLNRDGTVPTTPTPGSCTESSGLGTDPDFSCKPFSLESNKGNDYIETLTNEALSIGGTTLNVFKLLGVHEQGQLVDCVGRGSALSNGDLPNFPASNAFDKFVSEWRSIQRGPGVGASAYIGYDFGSIKTNDNTRDAYGIDTSIYKRIATIAIKQSSNPNRRITRARIERSNDGIKWYGVEAITLPNDDCLNTIQFKDSVPARYWRIRALDFNGTDTNDVWGVAAFQLFHDYVGTDLYNIQDKVLLENRDRNYNQEAIPIKGYYDLTDNLIDVSGFGIELPSLAMYITVSFVGTVASLGRPPVIGDIIEIPAEAQFSGKMEKILKWVEITDIGWDTSGYTPG